MTQIFLDNTRSATKPVAVDANSAYGEHLEEMRLAALDLIGLLAAERSGTFDGVGLNFWFETDRVLGRARKLFQLAEQRAASLKDGSFRR